MKSRRSDSSCAEREDLLELVHQHDQPLGPGGLAQGQAGGDVQRALAVLAALEAVEDHGARRTACASARQRRRPG